MTNSNVREKLPGFSVCLLLVVVFVGGICPAQTESIPADSPRWQLERKAKVAEYLGRRCLWLQDGVATLKDFEIEDGVIDLDMAASGARGFYGIFFRKQPNGNGEQVYLRPHKTGLDDAQQYTPL